jgi:hypothetical protein
MRVLFEIFLILVLGIFLLLSQLACLKGIFLQIVTLTSHGGFVTSNTGGSDDHTVHRNVHACFDFDDVTDNDVVVMNVFFLSVSQANDLNRINQEVTLRCYLFH